MRKILGIETSSTVGSVAIVIDEELVAECTVDFKVNSSFFPSTPLSFSPLTQEAYPSQHHSSISPFGGAISSPKETLSTWLMPAIDKIIKEANLTIQKIEGLAVSLGPGSFTGLRIGISTTRGLAQSLNKPVIGISTLEGLAYNLIYSKYLICPILDIRKGKIYSALYKSVNHELKRLTDYFLLKSDELIDSIKPFISKHQVIFVGDGLPLCQNLIKKSIGKQAIFVSQTMNFLRAANIAFLGLKQFKEGKKQDLFSLQPIYVTPLH